MTPKRIKYKGQIYEAKSIEKSCDFDEIRRHIYELRNCLYELRPSYSHEDPEFS